MAKSLNYHLQRQSFENQRRQFVHSSKLAIKSRGELRQQAAMKVGRTIHHRYLRLQSVRQFGIHLQIETSRCRVKMIRVHFTARMENQGRGVALAGLASVRFRKAALKNKTEISA